MFVIKSPYATILALAVLCAVLVSAPPASAKKEPATGPLVRPIAWTGTTCPLESFARMRFTAVDSVAELGISAITEYQPNFEECMTLTASFNIASLYVMPRSVYEAGLVTWFPAYDGERCLQSGRVEDLFDPVGIPLEDYIVFETSAAPLNNVWRFDNAEFQPGTGIRFYHNPGDDGASASVMMSGLIPGDEYDVTFEYGHSPSCFGYDVNTRMSVWVDTEPGILRVAADGSGDYLTVASALADAEPGDRLLVAPGNYDETGLTLPDSVSIIGETGIADDVWIAPTTPGRILTAEGVSGGAVLSGLTFADADSSAIRMTDSHLVIRDCRFTENDNATIFSGGIHAGGTGSLRVEGTRFDGNSTTFKGGAVRAENGSVRLVDCVFENNTSADGGGAVYALVDTLVVERCDFDGNTSSRRGGGMSTFAFDRMRVTDTRFHDNYGQDYGGGVRAVANGLEPLFVRCDFTGNRTAGFASALHLSGNSGAAWIEDSTFVGNGYSFTGSTVFISSGTVGFTRCTFVDNDSNTGILDGDQTAFLQFENVLLAFNGSFGVTTDALLNSASDCDVYGNAGSNYVQGLVGFDTHSGNLELDPLLCDPAGGNVFLGLDSPCLPDNHASGQQIGARLAGCAGEAPFLTSAADVPADQGGQLRLAWQGSQHDGPAGPTITGYAVYRRADPAAKAERGDEVGRFGHLKMAGWDYVATVPARGDTAYQTIVPTLCDSTIVGGPCWSTFLVSAVTPDPLTFFDSPADSGYSVDNLSPAAPSGLSAAFASGGVTLDWPANTDPDVSHYNVYRDPGGVCEGALGAPAAQTATPGWTDTEGGAFLDRCYRITAVDHAGNEGPATSWSSAVVSSVPSAGARFALMPGAPNPFNPKTTLSFTLRDSGPASLEIFDARGRRVRTLLQADLARGRHEVDWFGRDDDGRGLASGVYLVRLRQGGDTALQRVTLLK